MIATGGGAFDRDERPVFFVAGAPAGAPRRYHLAAVNEARSDSEARNIIEVPMDRGSQVLLDSGIFNLTNQHKRATGCSMDEALGLAPEDINGFGELYDRYVELVGRYEPRLWGYIELDQGGREHKRRTRARLHDLGLNPIPVYHPLNDGWDYFDELAEGYDRICFGNIVQASPPVRIRLLHTMWERRRRYPHLWVHVLGLTADTLSLALPADSCDSSTWAGALRWGRALIDSAYMNRGAVGPLPRGFVYNRDVDYHADGGWLQSAILYAAEFDRLTDVWRDLLRRRADLGFDPWPAADDNEGDLCPST